MKKHTCSLLLLLTAFVFLFQACSDDETYADKRKRENKQISSFLSSGVQVKSSDSDEYLFNIPGNIKVISEGDFARAGDSTSVEKNEYVYFDRTGVYMQIVEKGTGKRIASGETKQVLARFTEFNIAADSIQASNQNNDYETIPDKFVLSNTSGTFSATFTSGAMYTTYSSAAVPAGWLIPFTYINLGRIENENSKLAKVRLIVPSTQGHANASSNVYPCFYEITFEAGR